MEVRAREKCETCEGSGAISHPAWEEFWEEHPDGLPASRAAEEAKWWERKGYWGLPLPAEEITCPECEGTGWREKWVEIGRLMKEAEREYRREVDAVIAAKPMLLEEVRRAFRV